MTLLHRKRVRFSVAKRGHGEGSVYRSKDGLWHGALSRGLDPRSGKRRRIHVRGSTRREVMAKLDRIRYDISNGVQHGRPVTVAQWVDAWLTIAERTLKPKTVAGYQTNAKYIKERLGGVKLPSLTTEQIESLYDDLRRRGMSAMTIGSLHRSVRASLNEAVRRGYMARNPALHARPGRSEQREVEPLSIEDAQKIISCAVEQRNAARWAIALALGLRQGEALGLCWDDLDFDAGTIRIRRAIQRASWKHGCDARPCGKSPMQCPRRHSGGLIVIEPKSQAAKRTVVVPSNLLLQLKLHRKAQATERIAAGELWEQGPFGGWLFANQFGRPIDPRRDWGEWKEILAVAGVRDARLHDARHSAATYLLVQGVDTRTVMGILGWSQTSLTARYQHVVPVLKEEAARRMDQILWSGDGSNVIEGG